MNIRDKSPRALFRRTGVCSFFMFVACALSAWPESSVPALLSRAQGLNAQGDASSAISILEPLIRNTGEDHLDDVHRGIAWTLLGYSHQSMGQYEVARRCYESAIELLKSASGAEENLAVALENLAFLEGLMHQLDAASNLNVKARNLYEKNKNYAGMARTDTWLATIALLRNNVRHARSHLSSAFSEAQLARNQSDGERAAIYAVDGNIAARTHDYSHAVMAYQRSIDAWKDVSDRQCDVIAWEHALRGDANRELGNFTEAAEDFQAALALLERAQARTAPVYFQTEILYARLIRATGEELKAKRMEHEAQISLDKLRLGQCDGCSVSADSFR